MSSSPQGTRIFITLKFAKFGGGFATKKLVIKLMSSFKKILIMREQTLEYIEILCLQDDGYRIEGGKRKRQ